MTAVIPQVAFPTALVTSTRVNYWRAQWMIQLTTEMHRSEPREEVVTRCEEHIALCSIALEAMQR